jgi:hypothetical protein
MGLRKASQHFFAEFYPVRILGPLTMGIVTAQPDIPKNKIPSCNAFFIFAKSEY